MSERVFERANGVTAPKAHWCTMAPTLTAFTLSAMVHQ
jgi:hypothetical protein